MLSRSLLASVAFWSATFTCVARPAPAVACSELSTEIWVDDVPSNSVVVLTRVCAFDDTACFAGETPTELPLVDKTTGLDVPGEVLRIEHPVAWRTHIVWLPETPLVAGHTYEVTWRADTNGGSRFHYEDYEFQVLPAVDLDVGARAVTSLLYLTTETLPSMFRCEAIYTDACDNSPGTQRISSEWLRRAHLRVRLDEDALGSGISSAFELRAAFWADGEDASALGEPVWGDDHGGVFHVFDTAAEQYCYRVEMRSVVGDGTTAVHEACVPHGDLGEVGVEVVEPDRFARDVAMCVEPPAGYEAEWCAGRRAHCSHPARRDSPYDGCVNYESRCPEPEPAEPVDDPDSGAPSDADASTGVSGGDDAIEADTTKPAESPDSNVRGSDGDGTDGEESPAANDPSGGCSVGPRPAQDVRNTLMPAVALACAALARGRRRR